MELTSALGLKKVVDDLKKGDIFPVYLLTGDDDFLIKDATEKVINGILLEKERALNLNIFEDDSNKWNQIIDSLNTYPWIGGKRVIVVKDTRIFFSKFVLEEVIEKSKLKYQSGDRDEAVRLYRIALGYKGYKVIDEITESGMSKLPGFSEDSKTRDWIEFVLRECRAQDFNPIPYEDNSDKLVNALEQGDGIPKGNILILTTQHVDKRKKLYKVINDKGVIIDFSIQRFRRDQTAVEMDERNLLLDRAKEYLKNGNRKFGKGAFDALVLKTGYDVGMFVNELEKVISSANRETIEVEDINEIVGRTREDSVNDLQDAVSQRNFEKAAFFLKELLGQGEHHLYLLQSIIGQMRRLILIKEFIGNELEGKWNPRMNSDAFKKFIYFPIILRKKREKEEKEKGIVEREGRKGKSSLNVYRLPPDVLLKLCKGAENFTLEDLYGALEMLGEADVKFKSSRVPPALILEEILMGVCFK